MTVLSFLPAPLKGLIASSLMLLNTLIWVPLLLLAALLKLLLPVRSVRLWIDPILLRIAQLWIAGNSFWMRLTQRLDWDVQGLEQLSAQQWYLVVCNHRSWVDILVLQHLLNRRIALLKFFLKQQLIWVPLMGLAWWALDFPFMRRHSASYLQNHPQARGQDAATARTACAKFALVPTSVMNFVEGTRFTQRKHRDQASPYRHLLKPKAGGVSMALQAMGEKFGAVLDITLCYPQGTPSFLDFLQGRVDQVVARVHLRSVPRVNISDGQDPTQAWRALCEAWVNELWLAKDEEIQVLLQQRPSKMAKG